MRRCAVRAWIHGGSALLGIAVAICPSAASAQTSQQCNAAYEKAQVARKARKLRAARDELLLCSQSKCPGAITADCGPWLREVESAMPSVVVVARDASGNDVPAVKVSVDGAVVAPRLTGTPIDVDPGEHTFVFEPEQGQRVEQTLLINVGEKNRLVQVAIRPAASSGPVGKPADKPADKPPEPLPDEGNRGSGSIVPGVVVGVLGAGALGASIGLYFSAKSQLDGLRSSCAPHCKDSDVSPIKTKGIASDVTFGVGLAGLGTGALLVILKLVNKPAPAPPGTALMLAPTAGGMTAGFSGRF